MELQPYRPRLQRVNSRRPCQLCQHGDWCGRSADGQVVVCMRVESNRRTRNGGYLHIMGGDVQVALPVRPYAIPAVQPASIDQRDAVYATLMHKHLTLTRTHREALQRRGLSLATIERCGYRSTPTRAESQQILKAFLPSELQGMPGIFKQYGAYQLVDYGSGILIPYRDERSRIQALQLRRDDPKDAKYIWLSSSNRPQGTSTGSPLHFAQPHLIPQSDSIIITEGALKADICAEVLHKPFVAAAGVTTFGPDFAERLKAVCPNVERAIIAFDSDFKTNKSVKDALIKLRRELLSRFTVVIRTWPSKYKGLDDYLTDRKRRNPQIL